MFIKDTVKTEKASHTLGRDYLMYLQINKKQTNTLLKNKEES
jgi:hypothetical protein